MAICLDYSLNKNTENKASSEAPPEFADLINRMGIVDWVGDIEDDCALYVIQSRVIRIGRNFFTGDQIGRKSQNDKLFIKHPNSRAHSWRKLFAKQEQIAYLISIRLNLNVVPPTMAIEGYKDVINRTVQQDCKRYFSSSDFNYEGVVVQEGMNLASEQVHLNKEANDLFLIQHLNNEQLANAIFFNIITGRYDAGIRNSAIDASKRIMEFDNEYIGRKKTDSWLLDFFPNFILPKNSIANLLSKDVSVVDSVFKDVSQFEKTKFYSFTTQRYDTEDCTQINIVDNFNKLKKFLNDHKDADVKVYQLQREITPSTTPKTKILVRVDAGYPNKLYLRGEGAPFLNWNKGIEMQMVQAPDLWALEFDQTGFDHLKYKVLMNDNDQIWEKGNNHEIKLGQQQETAATF